jgi:hypothetical protein
MDIERTLRPYRPTSLGGVRINAFRGTATAFEVPVECGSTACGLIDCVKVSEYFDEVQDVRICKASAWKREGISVKPICFLTGLEMDVVPDRCIETHCAMSTKAQTGVPSILIQCFEIKVSVSDFHSKNGHNFVGNVNFYVVPTEIYAKIKDLVPKDIGIITYCNWSLRRRRDATFKHLSDEEQKWMILNVLKRTMRTTIDVIPQPENYLICDCEREVEE